LRLQQPENLAQARLDLLLTFKTDHSEFFLQGGFWNGKQIIALADRRPFKAVRAVQAHVNLGGLAAQRETGQSVECGQLAIRATLIAADDDKIMCLFKAVRYGLSNLKLAGVHRSPDCGTLSDACSRLCRSSSGG
jgi:hypothetical protein